MLGIPENPKLQIAGVLAKLRAGAGLVGLFDLFDNLSVAHKIIGNKWLKLIQQYPVDKVFRIWGEQPSKQFFTKEFGKYDCVASEGILTDTQRNLAYVTLIQMKELAAKLGDNFPISWSRILKFAPTQIEPEILKEVQQSEQQASQAQARIQKMQETLQQLAVAQAQSQLMSGAALAEERRAEAIENTADAAYRRAKTIQEIQNLQEQPWLEAMKLALEFEKLKQPQTQKAVK
jgi:hypothetical protein